MRITAANARVDGDVICSLSDGWAAYATPPNFCDRPAALDAASSIAASVPGTAASALRAAGLWRAGEGRDFDAEDWWFRTTFAAEPALPHEELLLHLDGIATVAEVYLNGELMLSSDSMFAAHTLDLGDRLQATNELAICCRALGPLLRAARRPRARWRTRLVAEGNLRFFRTMLLGRAPGFAPGPAPVGPWRGVRLERRRRVAVDELKLHTHMVGEAGVLSVRARIRALDGLQPTSVEVKVDGASGRHTAALELALDDDAIVATGELVVPGVARWWPHTHGDPVLHDVRLLVRSAAEPVTIHARRVGFRDLSFGASALHAVERDGLDVHVNGVRVFARGAVWTPVDAIGLAPSPDELREALTFVCDAGMNMLRLPGTGAYETDLFHDLCDELGILVWQDFMFANLDYPIAEESFRATVTREAQQELRRLAGRPSLTVLCGNSEIEQQVAMLGLDHRLGRGELFGELLPELVERSGTDAAYLPSAPCGGDLPFRTDEGVANYYGVGGYLRPIEDARRAGVLFASECLAFSNVPCEAGIEQLASETNQTVAVGDPRWKARVPRDAGSAWDFEDVRDHYLASLFEVDPVELRRVDPDRYLELSRAVTGCVMGEVFGEWRRAASPCTGGLVLWMRDLIPGAGWGILDSQGEPKVAYHHLRRALAPVAIWMTDEALGGIDAHVANDRPSTLTARLRMALYRDFEQRVDQVEQTVEVPARTVGSWNLEALLGRFVDISWAYRFGPPAQNLVVSSLERDGEDGPVLISQSVYLPTGPPRITESASQLGLSATAQSLRDGELCLRVNSRRLAYGVRIHAPGFNASDDAFSVEPGGQRVVSLHPRHPGGARLEAGAITALNLKGRLRIDPVAIAT